MLDYAGKIVRVVSVQVLTPLYKIREAIVVMSALDVVWMWALHFKVLRQSFYVNGKALSDKLSCYNMP